MKLPVILLLLIFSVPAVAQQSSSFISYTVDSKVQQLEMYLKDDAGKGFGSIGNLNNWLAARHKKLLFAMNGGMYMEDRTPLGLYVEKGEVKHRLNKATGSGNFYMKPNGVFYLLKNNTAHIVTTAEFEQSKNVQYATQSGPMLLVSGQINSAFKQGSANLNIRNGVGILPDGKIIFAMSKTMISFYDFAAYFKQLGCTDALYLDGFVSRTYYPAGNWMQTDGNFGVIIAVTQKQ